MAEIIKVLVAFAEHPNLAILGAIIFIYWDLRRRSTNGHGPPTATQLEKLVVCMGEVVSAVRAVDTARAINYPPDAFKQQVKDSAAARRILEDDVHPKVEEIRDMTRDIHGVLVRAGK